MIVDGTESWILFHPVGDDCFLDEFLFDDGGSTIIIVSAPLIFSIYSYVFLYFLQYPLDHSLLFVSNIEHFTNTADHTMAMIPLFLWWDSDDLVIVVSNQHIVNYLLLFEQVGTLLFPDILINSNKYFVG